MEVSEYHQEQLAKYAKFFRAKRDVQVRELGLLFKDAIDTRCHDAGNLLSAEEGEEILSSLERASISAF